MFSDPESVHLTRSSQFAFSDRPSLSKPFRVGPPSCLQLPLWLFSGFIVLLQLVSSFIGFAGLSPASFPKGKDLGSWSWRAAFLLPGDSARCLVGTQQTASARVTRSQPQSVCTGCLESYVENSFEATSGIKTKKCRDQSVVGKARRISVGGCRRAARSVHIAQATGLRLLRRLWPKL